MFHIYLKLNVQLGRVTEHLWCKMNFKTLQLTLWNRQLACVIGAVILVTCSVCLWSTPTLTHIGQTTRRDNFYKSLPPKTIHHLLSQCQRFNLITVFFSVRKQPDYKHFSKDKVDKRQKEYLEVLQSNLNHPCVERIHLFYVNDVDLKEVVAANLTNSSKLLPVKRQRLLHMSDFFIYASRNLINKPAVALNGDIMLGEGFEFINVERLLKDKLFYSLSRYDGILKCATRRNMCLDNYQGSHDTHIFALAKPLDESLLLKWLDYPINMNQAENGMLYTMKYIFNFHVTNPCLTVKTYHHHCSEIYGGGGGSNYSIYNFDWNSDDVHKGVAWPDTLMPHPDLSK